MDEKEVRMLIAERLAPMRQANFDRQDATLELISGTVFLMARLIDRLLADGATTPESMAKAFAEHYAGLSEAERQKRIYVTFLINRYCNR